MNEKRVNEIITSMESFSENAYFKTDYLNEMLKLQNEMIKLVFNDEHCELAKLRIWDVEKHLSNLNEEYGHPADQELQKFIEGSKILSNLIKAEFSGNKGEFKAFKALENLKYPTRMIKNIEIHGDDCRTEIDAVILSKNEIIIVEVKNTAKNIFIDESGNYFRTGEYLKLDCNIGKKMKLKENLLKNVLLENEVEDITIKSVVVFTNDKIEVHNKYKEIITCFTSQLLDIVERVNVEEKYSNDLLNEYNTKINNAKIQTKYPFDFDVAQYKLNFANVLSILENASIAKPSEIKIEDTVNKHENKSRNNQERVLSVVKNIIFAKPMRCVGKVATMVAIASVSAAIITKTVRLKS